MRFPILGALALASGCAAAASAERPALRLDDTVRPTRYAAELTVVPGRDSFSGEITIDVRLSEPKSIIWLNALDLKIIRASVGDQPARVIGGSPGFIGLELDRAAPAGPARLHFTYSGVINRKASAGVFELQERAEWYAYTQFEATDARRAFPCFDQPDFKTPWNIALRIKREHKAFANTPQTEETDAGNGMKVVRFATTKPLPSYLVAFAVGPFDVVNIGEDARSRAPLRIIVPKGRSADARTAAEEIPQLLRRLEDYFGSPYPFEKLDSVVMPVSNFAMENAGLITYSEGLLLATPDNDTITRRRTRAVVVAHEMAHQWFGDLVTTAWWNDIWLNESFASWLETKIVQEWKPEWRMDVQQVQDRLGAMRLDSLKTARKIRQPIESNNDIANAFDGITYEKGAAVIRMFEHWIGPEKFRRGVQLYMEQNAGGSATAKQFLAAISEAAGRDVAPTFSTFLDQAGVPVITVNLKCGDAPARVILSQKRYAQIGSPQTQPERWDIPVCIKYDAGHKALETCELMTAPEAEVRLTGATGCPAWLDANDQAVGYYRVAYQGGLLEKVLSRDMSALSLAEKVSTLGDIRALVDSGDISAAQALAILPRLVGDSAHEVISETIEIASLAVGWYVPDDLLPAGQEYIRRLYGDRAHRLGWTPRASDAPDDKLMRETLVPFVAAIGRDRRLIDEASTLAREWLKTRTGIDPNLLAPALQTAAAFGDRALFDQLMAAAKSANDSTEQSTLLRALASFRNPDLAQKAMALLLTPDFDARQAFYPLMFQPLENRTTARIPFEFTRAHWDELVERLPHEVGSDYAAALPRVGGGICDPETEQQYVEFFEGRVQSYAGAPRTFAQTRESIRVCIAQRNTLGPEIADFLRKLVNPPQAQTAAQGSSRW
jgi:alanyl aminopeptidase